MKLSTYQEILQLQDTCNARASNDNNWAALNRNWGRAIRQEGAEAVESTPWKWWKGVGYTPINWDNIQVELVDIFHFIVSIYIQRGLTASDLKLHLEDGFNSYSRGERIPDSEIESLVQCMEGITFHSFLSTPFCIEKMTNKLGLSWSLLGLSLETLYTSYMCKNVLNIFRYDNGYRANTYKKEWKFEGEKVEDNVVAFQLLERLKVSSPTLDMMGVKLQAALHQAYEPTRKASAAATKRKTNKAL